MPRMGAIVPAARSARSVEASLPIVPPRTTHQQKKVAVRDGRPFFYRGKSLKQAEATLEWALMPVRPRRPLAGPLALDVLVTFPFRKGKKRCSLHVEKPDIDNWLKGFLDCMQRLAFFRNDSAIVELRCRKRRGSCPGIWFCLSEIDVESADWLG